MKKVMIMVVVLTLFVFAASSAFAVMSGSKHDLRSVVAGLTEICVVCHTPHNADTTVTLAPLWNHNIDTTTVYTPYASSTLNGTMDTTFSGISALCMGCHDGTIGLDSFGYNSGTGLYPNGVPTLITGNALLDVDLTDDHPVSFIYNTALETLDGELNAATTVTATLPLYGNGGDTKVECATCHDVHDPSNGFFLRLSNAGSAVCLVCHAK